jgi:hypothetical protein
MNHIGRVDCPVCEMSMPSKVVTTSLILSIMR